LTPNLNLERGISLWYHASMNARHRRTLAALFEKPERSDIAWRDIEALFLALGGEVTEGSGSRVRVALNGVRAVFHRPHPERVTDKGAVKSVRRFLSEAGVVYP
jgi:HicA toxin of bacterial toxin-antitoxin,